MELGEGAAGCRQTPSPGWRRAFAFPHVNAGTQLEDGDVFLMHLRVQPDSLISLFHVSFTGAGAVIYAATLPVRRRGILLHSGH